ncbi:threonine/serine exporter family protein [Petroclostridium sp. X23]|uniref:threonine/serine exporter family protein n=1 Tax=Petroclostridium sp. X23 TaxID=3045146 RepID=UPI0024ADE225|nr:threonine/serine exporter family protein [Petroclostridium sp. X23]WHH59584.1 threonine/serine exporter family protein [Petroclostridium sp. X23]
MTKTIDNKDILKLVILAGQIMLENGAETYRVEDTMERICRTADIKSVNTFATPTGIFVSIHAKDDEHYTTIRRVKSRTTNLSRVYQVNNISRQFVTNMITFEEALDLLENVKNDYTPKMVFNILSAGCSSGFFALLLSGSIWDGLIATFCGGLIQAFTIFSLKRGLSYFITNLIAGSISAIIAVLFADVFHIGSIDKIIIGSIMPLLPGLAITSAIRDTIYGDLVSGTTRGVEALLIAVSIASGVGIILKIWIVFLGGYLL